MGILAKLEIDYDLDIVEEFISHFSFMCESLETLIINLEKEEYYSENIQELFRIFHNIKSASGFLNLEVMVKLATLTEEVLEEARLLEGPATAEFVDWLLKVSDQLELYRQNLENDSEEFSAFNSEIMMIPTKLEKS